MPNQWVRITKTVVDETPLPVTGQTFLRDAELKGFGLRLTAQGGRAFIVEKRVGGRVRRMTLGRFGELTVQQARVQAQKLLGHIAMGQDPVADKHRARLEAVTLAEAFQDFLKARPGLKASTVYDYTRFLKTAFGDWHTRPLTRITKDDVMRYHKVLGETRGEYYANGAMRFLRSVLNFAMGQYEDSTGKAVLTENVVLRLTRTRAWYRTERRQTVIRAHELGAWYAALQALRTEDAVPAARTVGDYLLVLLFMGLRRQEGAQLRWADVDLKSRMLTIPDPKNRVPHVLPLPDFVHALLVARQAQTHSPYVFDGEGKKGYLVEPRRWVQEVTRVSGIAFTLHDLRRTFATIAESIDVSPYTLKRLLNHKMRNDVTAGYIITDLERLRAPIQKIADYLQQACGIEATPILQFPGLDPAASAAAPPRELIR